MFATLKNISPAQIRTRLLADTSLTKKASLNAAAAILDYGAQALMGFILQPLLVAGLGDYMYGIWQIFIRQNGYLQAASGRSTQTLKWTLAKLQSSTDDTE